MALTVNHPKRNELVAAKKEASKRAGYFPTDHPLWRAFEEACDAIRAWDKANLRRLGL